MPIPKPKDKEKKSEFISRCISAISSEYKDNKQAVAICYTTFEEAKASADMVVDMDGDEMLVISDAAQKTFKGKTRSELKDSDFLFPDKRSFPIVSPQDVRDAISNFGRMGGDMSYDVFIKKLYEKAKSKGAEFVAAIPESTKKKYKLDVSKAQDMNMNSEEMEEENPEEELKEVNKDLYEMAVGSIASIKSHADAILNSLNDPSVQKNLTETWMQGKLAVAEDYLVTVHNYVMFNKDTH
jgi:hypothetical protein